MDMDYESILMGMINSRLTNQVNKSKQYQEREDRSMPNSTRRAFESRMKTDAAVYRVAAQNMEDAKAMVNVAQTTTTAIKSQFQEVQKILTEAATQDSRTIDDYREMNKSLIECFSEIERLATNASFNGMKLMDGTTGNGQGSAGQGVTVVLQAGGSTRNQNFMNLLDGSGTNYTPGNPSMDLSVSNLVGTASTNATDGGIDYSGSGSLMIDTSGTAANAQASAQTALDLVEKYIDGITGLEAQYSYDYKSLDNLSILFEEQADIFEEAGQRSSAFDSPNLTTSEILSQLVNNPSILSGTT